MKLHSIKIQPRKPNGLESDELFFGAEITELFGPNGCGKTPIIKSIAYALGYPVRYREDILERCDSVRLTLQTSGGLLRITRRICPEFDVEIQRPDGQKDTFYKDRDFSQHMFDLLGIPSPTLTSVANEATPPYMATLLPLFYLDQDIAYTTAYKAPSSFIRDQHAEMSRLMFGLQPKHSFDHKRLLLERKKRLEVLDQRIVDKEKKIHDLVGRLGRMRRPLRDVDSEIAATTASLNSLKSSHGTMSDAQLALDGMLYDKKSLRRQLAAEISDLQARIRSFEKIKAEIETELNTLSLNEEARRLFASFKDICANPSCGLFISSSESYGKSLLYLRDQIKDLERTNSLHEKRIEALSLEMGYLNKEIGDLEEQSRSSSNSPDVGSLVDIIGGLTRNIIALQEEAAALESIDQSEREYVELLNERSGVQDELASLDSRPGSNDLRALKIRGELRERIRFWLDVLQTRNVSREVNVDSDFETVFGNEKLSQFTGSTLLRVVLSLRTAAFEVYAKDPAKELRFLILDTPRQQDIEKEALARYISELKKLAGAARAQIVFSTTDYHYDCNERDAQWSPQFSGAEQKMFLNVVR